MDDSWFTHMQRRQLPTRDVGKLYQIKKIIIIKAEGAAVGLGDLHGGTISAVPCN